MSYTKEQRSKNYTNKTLINSGIAVGGAGALGLKEASKDATNLKGKLENWHQSLEADRQFLSNNTPTLEHSEKVFDTYIKGGRELSRTRFLGIPAGIVMQGQDFVSGKLPLIIDSKLNKHPIDPGGLHAFNKRLEHHRIYTDKRTTHDQLKSHMVEKAVFGNDVPSEMKNFSPEIKDIAYGHNSSFENKYQAIKKLNPQAAENFKHVITGNDKVIGETKRLAGDTKGIISTPETYKLMAQEPLNAIKEIGHTIHKPLLAIGATLAGIGIIKKTMEKKGSVTIEEKTKTKLKTGLIVAGAPATAYGFHKYKSTPRNVVVTYGEMPNIGGGHKAPGQAFKQLIEGDERFSKLKTNVDIVARDQYGIARVPEKKYNTLIDTGLGADHTQAWAKERTLKTHRQILPDDIKANTKFRYLTDAISDRTNNFGSNMQYKGRNKVIFYGPNEKHLTSVLRIKPKIHNVSEGLTPLIDKNSIEEIKHINSSPVNSDQMLSEITEHAKSTGASAEELQHLEGLKGKKLITVAGAARGDYVAIRAKEVQEALKKHNLHNDYGVLALMASGKNSAQSELIRKHNIPHVGLLPRTLYNKAQAHSEINWGASGTSGLSEASLMKNIQVLPGKWGSKRWDDKEGKPQVNLEHGSIAHRQDQALGYTHPYNHVNLDEWNAGNIDYFHKQSGTKKIDSGEELIQTLKNTKEMSELKAGAGLRATNELAKLEKGRKATADLLYKTVKGNIIKSKAKGILAMGLGAGAIGYGINSLLNKKEK